MSHYKLIYYNLQGRGEPIRYMFSIAGVEFEDYRIPKNESTHPKLPLDIKDTLPWGTIPVLEVDGKKIGQSLAIYRFLANRFNLVGADEFEKAECDELVDSVWDFGHEWRALLVASDETKKAENLKKLTDITIPYYLGKYTKILEANGSKWLVGKDLTWADIVLAHTLKLIMNHSKMPFVDGFPVVKQFIQRVDNVPQIKEWIKKRPDTD